MRSNLMSTSRFGTFYPKPTEPSSIATKTVQLQQVKELTQIKLTLQADRLYLLDSAGCLCCLNLKDQAISTLPTHRLQEFHPDTHSSLSLTGVSPSSQLLCIQFHNKQVSKRVDPCLGKLVAFQKNQLTNWVMLADPKALVLVDPSFKVKSIKPPKNDLITSACLAGPNRLLAILFKSGSLKVYQTATCQVLKEVKLPSGLSGMKVCSSNCGTFLAVYGQNNKIYFFEVTPQQIQVKTCQLPFQTVLQLQFSYSGQLVLLGSDRVLYGLCFKREVGSLKPLFNYDQQQIPTTFDISTDQKLIALAAGKAVHLLSFKAGLEKAITKAEGVDLLFGHSEISDQGELPGQSYTFSQKDKVSDQRNQIDHQLKPQSPPAENSRSSSPKRQPIQVVYKFQEKRQADEEEEEEQEDQTEELEALLRRQEQIKQALRNIRQNMQ